MASRSKKKQKRAVNQDEIFETVFGHKPADYIGQMSETSDRMSRPELRTFHRLWDPMIFAYVQKLPGYFSDLSSAGNMLQMIATSEPKMIDMMAKRVTGLGDKSIVEDFKRIHYDQYTFVAQQADGNIFMNPYGAFFLVKGHVDPIELMKRETYEKYGEPLDDLEPPFMLNTALIPFRKKLTYTGLVSFSEDSFDPETKNTLLDSNYV